MTRSLGKRTALEVEVADGGLIIYVPWEERNAGYYGLEVTGTCNSKKWATYADSLIHYTRATEMGAAEVTIESDYYDITQVVGFRYSESPIKKVTSTIDDEVGTPKVDADYDGKILSFEFHNMKGNRGNGIASSSEVLSPDDGGTNTHTFTDDDGNEHTFHTKNGRKGGQGDSFQPIEDVSGLVLAHTTGQDNTKAMSQKGVTDALEDAKDAMGEIVTVEQFGAIPKADFVDGNVIVVNSPSSPSTQYCWFLTVNAGDKVTITATNATTAGCRYAFATVLPAGGITVQGKTNIGGTSVNATIESPLNGYMVLNHSNTAFVDRVVKILRKGNYTELQEKAPLKTMMDVVGMLDYDLSNIDVTQVLSNSINIYGTLVSNASTSYRVYEFAVQSEKLYKIHGRLSASGNYVGYVFYDANWMPLSHGEQTNGSVRTFDAMVMSPKGAAYLRVSGTTSINGMLAELVSSGNGQKTIYPKMSYEYLRQDNGFFGTGNKFFKAVSTVRFIKVNGDFTVTLPEDRELRLVEFDKDFNWLRQTSYSGENYIQADVETPLSVGANTRYVKIGLADYSGQEGNISIVRMKLRGAFPDDWDTFNISQFGCDLTDFIKGRQLVIAWARLTDPTCCNDDTSNPQDTGEYFVDCGLITRETYEAYGSYLWDYGKIFLPATYDNLGEPTRLIIYCHGAAVNYGTGNASSAEVRDLDPTYWLAEGYAILDVEGNPFNNEDEHIHSPQALECYVAAYKWAIEHYNLKRDGVFLGGRSLGGGMTLALIRKECPIPIIAACPNVPSVETIFHTTPERKTFWAKCCGIHIPSGFIFQDGRTVADRQVFMDNNNWDRWIKQVPLVSVITDLPVTAAEKEDFADHIWGTIDEGTTTDEVCFSYFMTKHAEVKCPVKIFGCYEDASIDPMMGPRALYRMLINAGQIAEFRLFHDSRYPAYSKGSDAHHYDTNDPAQRQDGVVTRYGTTVDDVPTVYIEMLKFWRRFEQE